MIIDIRHACEQDPQILGTAWTKHDGKHFGTQHITDYLNNIELDIKFVKMDGENGGDWAVRIHGSPLDSAKPSSISLVFYVALENSNGKLEFDSNGSIEGSSEFLGKFKVSMIENEDNLMFPSEYVADGIPDISLTNRVAFSVPNDDIWKAKLVLKQVVTENGKKMAAKHQHMFGRQLNGAHFFMAPATAKEGNLLMFQTMFPSDFQVEYVFSSNDGNFDFNIEAIPRSFDLDTMFENGERHFDATFEEKFGLKSNGLGESQIEFGKMLLSNMLGGLGYFYGESIVDRSLVGLENEEPIDFLPTEFTANTADTNDYFSIEGDETTKIRKANPEIEGPFTLFTGVPSRPFFPRGFMWDSGFDQLVIGSFDSEISLDIISHWANLIDKDGWVAREQILGPEARSKVPEEFQTQFPTFANPPTLVLGLSKVLAQLKSSLPGMSIPCSKVS